MNVIAVDVGTTSVRLAIVSFRGEHNEEVNILASHKQDIDHFQDGCKFEQRSADIWRAICECSQECIINSKVLPSSLRSIAFSATCSLVIQLEDEGIQNENDIIMWMDHRAIDQAHKITTSKSKVLEQFGGTCSPEFSLSKLIWLKDNEPQRFKAAIGFFELPDWLVYKCIGGEPISCNRSLCCVTCKWGYDVDQNCHCELINSLESKLVNKIGGKTAMGPGTVAGYLSEKAARELGLISTNDLGDKENLRPLKVAVGTSLIDAHAGMLAMLSVPLKRYNIDQQIESTFCSLAGTSSCHMLLSKKRNFTKGIWGPYKDVVIRGYHLLEAGQSLTGKLIEITIESHEEGKKRLMNGEKMYDIIRSLNEQVLSFNFDLEYLHVLPSFHGNRSPLANPILKGGYYGLSVEGTKSLLEYYIATVESLVYETKLIVETLGTKINTILVSGGLMKNWFYMQTLADVLQCQVVKMSFENVDFMVMGSGLVARHAALNTTTSNPLTRESIEDLQFKQLNINMFQPNLERVLAHEKRYLCYKEFVNFSQRVDKIMHT